MARHRRELDSNGPSAEQTSYNTVFVDTSLDTHLVLIISSSDTVSDFKKKILLQHSESFPRTGSVKIHSVQVKRQGHFYHLPDSMLVNSAFNGSKKTWFLFVEASCSEEDEKEQLSHKIDDTSENCSLLYLQKHSQGNSRNVNVDDPLKLASEKVPQAVQAYPRHFAGEISRDIEMEVGHLQDDCQKELSSDIDKSLALPGSTLEKNIRVSENAARSEDDDSRNNNKSTMVSGLDELPSTVKKHKIEHIENLKFTMKKKHKVADKKNPLVDASGEVPRDVQTRKIRGELYDTLSSDANWMSISGAQKTSESETNAEQSGKLQREEVDRDQSNSTTGEYITIPEKVPSSQEVKEDNLVIGVGSKKKKKKQKKILSVPHDQVATSEPNHVLDGSVFQPNLNTEPPEANKNKGDVELVLTSDPEVMVSNRCKPSDEGEADGINKELISSPNFMGTSSPQVQPSESFQASEQVESPEMNKGSILSCDLSLANEVAEAGNSGTIKRKKRKAKNSAAELQDKSDVDKLHETSLPAEGVAPDVEMNDETTEKNITVPHIESKLENDRELSSRYKSEVVLPEGNKLLDSGKATMNDKESGFAEMSLDNKYGPEAGKSGRSHKKKRVKRPSTTNDNISAMEHSNTVNASPAKPFEGDTGLSLNCEPEMISPEANRTLDLGEVTGNHSDSGKATVNDKESVLAEMSLDNKYEPKAGKSGHRHKKKRVKRPPTTNDDISAMEHSNAVNASPAKHFEGDTGLSLDRGPEMISSEANRTLDLGEVTVNHSDSGKATMNDKESDFASQELDNEDVMEAGKSDGGQKKKRTKKCASSVCDSPAKHFASEAQGNQSIFSGTEEKKESRDPSTSHASKGNETSESKKIVSPLPETDQTWETAKDPNDNLREAENDQSMDTSALQDQPVKLQANEVQHLLHDEADREQTNAENIKKKVKKTKRKQNAAGRQSNSKTKGQNTSIEELSVLGDEMEDRNHPYDTMNTNVSAEAGAGDEGINFRRYFVPEQNQNENASANKVKAVLHSTEAKRKTKKPNIVSDGTVKSNPQRHNKSNTNDDQLEESSVDAKGNQNMPGANKEIPQTSGNVVKASKSHDVDKEKTPWKATKPVVANGFRRSSRNKSRLEENNGSVAASSSSSSAKGSKRAFQDTTNKKQPSGSNSGGTSARKFSNRNDGDIVNCSQQKSLLSAPGAIFNDDSSESSGDENQFGNSDASTRTPSDNSSSSGNSDGESELSQDSRGNGSKDAKMEDGGRESTLNSKFPDPENRVKMVLRSSKWFKQAELTLSQSQEADTESQPVDFVPESQANL